MIVLNIAKKLLAVTFLPFLLAQSTAFPQNTSISEFEYLSPVPGSALNQPETNIIIRYGTPYNVEDILNRKILEVKGDKSGNHFGKIILVEDNKTLLYTPDLPFIEGETVNVKFIETIRSEDGEFVPALNFDFRITKQNTNKIVKNDPKKCLIENLLEIETIDNTSHLKQVTNHQNYSVMTDSLPADFPNIEIDSVNNPTPGLIFLTPFDYINRGKTYLVIMDNYGIPVFYRQTHYLNLDFKLQPTGVLTYYDELAHKFYILDSFYSRIDSLYAKNGYSADGHELRIKENNHSLMMSYDWQLVPMDTVVSGGDPNATVIGLVIQEQDENKNVVFQWRSWDHFKITDATYDIDLTDSIIDYVHANALDVDNDGNILVSCRHMDEVTKIDRQTGDIIWRWGGEQCENNQFTFINDPIGFSHQHHIRKLGNGNLTVFDNGNLHFPAHSRAAEYQLDEVNKLAFLVWEYGNDPQTFSFAMGNAQRLSNHNTFIGWGSGTSPAISEVSPDGDVELFLSIPDTLLNYRGFKFPWKTNLFVSNPDTLYFGYVQEGDSLILPLEIVNNSNQQIEINSIYNRESAYVVLENLPIIIAPFGSVTISVKFKSNTDGDCFDDLHLRWETEGQRIAQVVPLIGSGDPNFTFVENEVAFNDYFLNQNYPNPFNPTTSISFRIPQSGMISLKVYDMLGKEVATLVNEEKTAGSYEVEFNTSTINRQLSSGIYFYQLRVGDPSSKEGFVQTKKMILLK